MSRFATSSSLAIALATFGATAAWADLTAEDVWADWQQLFGLYGEDAVTTTSESRSGDTLTITGLEFAVDFTDGNARGSIDEITMTEAANGVIIEMSEEQPIVINGVDSETGEPFSVEMRTVQNGLMLIATGDPGAIDYALTADSYGVVVDSMQSGDEVLDATAQAFLEGVTGVYATRGGDLREIDYALEGQRLAFEADISGTEAEPGRFTVGGEVDGISIAAQTTLPIPEGDPGEYFDSGQALRDGFSLAGGYEFGPTKYGFAFESEGQSGEGQVASQGGNIGFEFGRQGIAYSGQSNDTAIAITSSDLPFPIELAASGYGFEFAFPLAAQDTASDASFAINLTDFVVSDGIWNLFDPGEILPRDPATVALDLGAKLRILTDLVDVEDVDSLEDAPAELESATLNDLTVRLAGAELTGEGGFTFDYTDMETFNGFPRPEGVIELMLTGGNALLDDLIQLGVVPEEQAMGIRMMSGMFARPGPGEDTLTSRFEVTPDGQVLANGQRIR